MSRFKINITILLLGVLSLVISNLGIQAVILGVQIGLVYKLVTETT